MVDPIVQTRPGQQQQQCIIWIFELLDIRSICILFRDCMYSAHKSDSLPFIHLSSTEQIKYLNNGSSRELAALTVRTQNPPIAFHLISTLRVNNSTAREHIRSREIWASDFAYPTCTCYLYMNMVIGLHTHQFEICKYTLSLEYLERLHRCNAIALYYTNTHFTPELPSQAIKKTYCNNLLASF